MSDLASQPETSETPLTIAERRANYEDWLKSGRRTERMIIPPDHVRLDDLPSNLAAKRAKAGADSASRLISELPPGYICRADEGEGETPDNEEIRLKLAGALASKMEGVDADTATRMANAGNALLAPLIIRADDEKADAVKADENLKNEVLNQGKGGVAGDKAADDAAPTLAAIMDTLGKITGRLDAIEAKGKDSEHTSTPPSDKKKEVADDDTIRDDGFRWRQKQDKLGTVICSPDTQDAFAVVQARADKVYMANGQQADKPLYGETLSAYRRRLLKPLQKYSDHFKNSDLRVVAVDPAAFMAVEDSIYKSATDAARDPRTVPLGFLREHVEQRGGHTYTTFTGRPISWMSQFAPSGRRVRRIIERGNGGVSRTLYERA